MQTITTITRSSRIVEASSCTLNEIVARLLGWMPGDIRCEDKKKIGQGSATDPTPKLLSLDEPFMAVISDRFDILYSDVKESEKANADEKVLEEKREACNHCAAEGVRASSFVSAIKRELDNGDSSDLRIAHRATIDHGTLCILHEGLNLWVKEKFQSSAFEFLEDTSSEKILVAEPKPLQGKRREGDLRKVKADNLYTSFAFLVEAFSKSSETYHDDNGPIVMEIAMTIAKLAKKAYGDIEFMPGQGHGAIKKNIVEAMKRKKHALINN